MNLNLDSMGAYREAVNLVRRPAKPVVFWSFISLFYLIADVELVSDNQASTMWGLSISGFTERKFLFLLLIMVLYFSIKHLFVVCRIFLVSDGLSTLDQIMRRSAFDIGWTQAEATTANDKDKETWILMVRHRVIGFS